MDGAILNADGVYLATYSALLLNLKLLRNGYYQSEEKSLCMAEVTSENSMQYDKFVALFVLKVTLNTFRCM